MKEIAPHAVRRFLSAYEDECLWLIPSGDLFIVVHDDAHEITLGQTFVGTKKQVETKYGLEI